MMKPWDEQGGAAFPVVDDVVLGAESGMSLRDRVAIEALGALITKGVDDHNLRGAKGAPVLCKYAFEYADEWLKARQS